MVVTKKANKQEGAWLLTGDIRARFPSAKAVTTAYEQQRTKQSNKDTHADRLLTYIGEVCPVIIPTGRTYEKSQDASLHKEYIACQMFIGRTEGSLHKIFRDSL